MCSHTVQFLQRQEGLTVAYYFCNSHTDSKDLCWQVLRTWALQILRANLDLTSYIADNYVYKGTSSSASQMRKLVLELLGLASPSRIVLDGIDECLEQDQKMILQEVQSMLNKLDNQCKILISSRDTTLIRKALRKASTISLNDRKDSVDTDIQLFVRQSLTDLEDRFGKHIIEELAARLIAEADGNTHITIRDCIGYGSDGTSRHVFVGSTSHKHTRRSTQYSRITACGKFLARRPR